MNMPQNNAENKNMKIRLAAAVISLLSAFCLPEMIDISDQTVGLTNTIWSVGAFAAFYLIQCMAVPSWLSSDRLRRIMSAITAGFFTAAMIWGRQLDQYGQLEPGCIAAWVSFIVMTVQFSTLICLMTQYINRNGFYHLYSRNIVNRESECFDEKSGRFSKDGFGRFSKSESGRLSKGGLGILSNDGLRRFTIDMVIMIVCWLPVLLAVYPGFFVYDAQSELNEVMTRNFTNHHPLLHVLLMGGTICGVHKFTGSYNAGIFCYTVIQMIVMAAVFAYILRFIRRHSTGQILPVSALIWFAVFPVNVMYVLCTTKDTLFSGALLLSIVLLFEMIESKDKKELRIKGIAYTLSVMFMILMRHNGFYALIVAIPFIVIFAKKNRKKILISSASAAVLAMIFTAMLNAALCPNSESEHQEMFTVPIQQLARTYQADSESFTADERAALLEILPESSLAHYTPQLSDILKLGFDNEAFDRDPGKYIKLWFSVGVKHPMSYLNAWFMTSYGYWYPDSVNNTYKGNTAFTYTYDESSYFGFETELPGTRESKIPWLESLYHDMSLSLYQQKVPVVSMLFSPGFICWVYIFMFVLFIVSGRGRDMIPFVIVVTVWLTVLLGPGCLNRYVVYGWMGLPLLLCKAEICKDVET